MHHMLLMLAPMVNITHAAFRELVHRYCSEVVLVSEMVNVRYLRGTSPDKDPYLLPYSGERDLWIQLVGRDVEDFEIAVDSMKLLNYTKGYNLNLGCVKGRFQRFKWGAHLLDDPDQIEQILSVLDLSGKPLSVKMRYVEDRGLLERLLAIFERYGLDFVVVHARTVDEGFRERAKWARIRDVVSRTDLRVVGNGDVFSPGDAVRMLEETGACGVMVGRAAAIRPWIFRDIMSAFKGVPFEDPPDPVEPVLFMAEAVRRYLPGEWWEKRFMEFMRWYLQNFDFALYYLRQLNRADGFEAKVDVACKLLSGERMRPYPVRPFLFNC